MRIIAPPEYYALTPEEKHRVCNGCGAAAARFDLVPDRVWGLDISEACNIHDYDYSTRRVHRHIADAVFLANLALLISRGSKWLMLPRLYRACKYFLAVHLCGGRAYDGGGR